MLPALEKCGKAEYNLLKREEIHMDLFKRIAALFVSAMLLFANAVDNGGENSLGEARLISTDRYVLCDGDYLTQGITTDGTYYYCTGARTYCKN